MKRGYCNAFCITSLTQVQSCFYSSYLFAGGGAGFLLQVRHNKYTLLLLNVWFKMNLSELQVISRYQISRNRSQQIKHICIFRQLAGTLEFTFYLSACFHFHFLTALPSCCVAPFADRYQSIYSIFVELSRCFSIHDLVKIILQQWGRIFTARCNFSFWQLTLACGCLTSLTVFYPSEWLKMFKKHKQ